MQIKIDDKVILDLTDSQVKVLADAMKSGDVTDLIEASIKNNIASGYSRAFEVMRNNWVSVLAQTGVTMVPLDSDAFAQIIFALPEYKSVKEIDADALTKS